MAASARRTWRCLVIAAATAVAFAAVAATVVSGGSVPSSLDLLELPGPATAHGER